MESAVSTAPAKPATRTAPQTAKPRHARLWNVVLLDDQDHSYEYVISMMQRLFGYPVEKGFEIAKRVDKDGRAVCLTTHREHAELKAEQIHAYGADPLMKVSKGSMSAILEPAECGGDEGGA